MTEKRFEYTAYDDGTESIYDKKEKKYYYDMQLSNIEELLNELFDENEQLKEVLKKQYVNEICETCKYGDYFEICLIGEPTEYDFECEKGHDDCCDITECEDYELKDIEEFEQ